MASDWELQGVADDLRRAITDAAVLLAAALILMDAPKKAAPTAVKLAQEMLRLVRELPR